MNDILVSSLRCPVCHAGFCPTADGKSVVCRGGRQHCFDFAKSGYLNLVVGHSGGGDDREMVRARTAFLGAGYYEPIADAVTDALCTVLPNGGFVLDAGCGEGYYTCRIAGAGYTVLGADLSKAAVDHGAKSVKNAGIAQNSQGSQGSQTPRNSESPPSPQNFNSPRSIRNSSLTCGFAAANLFDLPVADGKCDAVVSIFAPIAEQEFLRVLRPGGFLILVGAGREHLMGLKRLLYEDQYLNEPRADLPKGMTEVSHGEVYREIEVRGNPHIRALFSMTPYYWRTSEADRSKLDGVAFLRTQIDVQVLTFRKDM